MIKKLKLILLGMVCLVVTCVLCFSLNAQSSVHQNSNSDDIAKLTKLIQQETELTKVPLTEESVRKLDEINLMRTKLLVKAEEQALKKATFAEKEGVSLYQDAQNLNKEYAEKGIPFKTQIKTVGGKQYIQLVELPDQQGMAAKKKQ